MNTSLETMLSISYLVPMGNPIDPSCVWGQPLVLHGPPGIGKTARVHQSAASLGLPVGVIELGGAQPEDAKGVPFLTKDDKIVIACLLQQVNELNNVGRGVLFLDEINWARPATQGAFLSAVQHRRVGDTQFSNFIRVILAGNPLQDAGGGYALIPPMANRLAHIDVEVASAEEEASYLMSTQREEPESIEDGEQKVIQEWSSVYPTYIGLMVGFNRRFPQHRHHTLKVGDPKAHKAWASPRSRENAIRCMATCQILGHGAAVQDEFFRACCGDQAAIDWATWRAEADLPDPKDALEKGFMPDPRRLDKAMAVYASVVAYVISRPTNVEQQKYAIPAWGLLRTLIEKNMTDIAITPIQKLINANLSVDMGNKDLERAAAPILSNLQKAGFMKIMGKVQG